MTTLKEDFSRAFGELIETHISWVFLDENTVWKIKKPVNLGFLDYSSAERRRIACEAEVRLNSRLAPGVYQGVVPVTRDVRGHHALDGNGEVVDFAVKMVRLPEERRADVLLARGQLSSADLEAIAVRVAEFHAAMPATPEIAVYGGADSILANIRENFSQARPTIQTHLSKPEAREIEAEQTAFVEGHRDLFAARIHAKRVRDGHGDLRLEHVYLLAGGPPVIVDCIEFNERFRCGDVCADIAFLSMDLARLGRADLAEQVLAFYARASNDYDLYPIVDFYESYRAYVRGKVASIVSADTGAAFDTRERARKDARRSYLLALSAARRSLLKPCVVAVGGVIASGKSTVSERLGRMMSAPVVDTDRTRKHLAGVDTMTHLEADAWSGAYAADFTERVYCEVMRRAAAVLYSGRAVVIDASFRTSALRALAQRLAIDHRVPFYFVECGANESECRKRLARRANEQTVSDGRLAIFADFAARWEPVDELPPSEHVVIDTALPLERNLKYLGELLPTWPAGLTG